MTFGRPVLRHWTPAEIHECRNTVRCQSPSQKWLVGFTALADPRQLEVIARQVGFSLS